MSYSLSFSPEFFLAEGEPCDRADYAVNEDGKPVSVWTAVCMMQRDEPELWSDMARELWQCLSEYLSPETVLDAILETNTCSSLSSPVEVWIDRAGDYRVSVY